MRIHSLTRLRLGTDLGFAYYKYSQRPFNYRYVVICIRDRPSKRAMNK